MLAALLVNINRDPKKSKPVTVTDFMPFLQKGTANDKVDQANVDGDVRALLKALSGGPKKA